MQQQQQQHCWRMWRHFPSQQMRTVCLQAPSWESRMRKSNSSLLLSPQNEEASAWARHKCQNTFILTIPDNLQKHTKCVWILVWAMHWVIRKMASSNARLISYQAILDNKMVANAERRDDIITWPTFYSLIWKDSECPPPVTAFGQTTGPEALVDQNQYWADLSSFTIWGQTDLYSIAKEYDGVVAN